METLKTESRQMHEGKPQLSPLHVPKSVSPGSSHGSSPFFQKLPPLSPRRKASFEVVQHISPDFRRKSAVELSTGGSMCSADSTSSSQGSESNSVGSEGRSHFDFQVKQTTVSDESTSDDIDFFLQVVGVFREYVTEQIALLESQHSQNQKQQQLIQKEAKKIDEDFVQKENRLSRDIIHLISLLHKKQGELKEQLKRKHQAEIGKTREQDDKCRRNMMLISGIVNFAKRLKNESGESLKENSVKELKQRLSSISDLNAPYVESQDRSSFHIDVGLIEKHIQNIRLLTTEEKKPSSVFILAASSNDDIGKDSLVIRWRCAQESNGSFEVQYKYTVKGKTMQRKVEGVNDTSYIINNLPPNCDVTIQIRPAIDTGVWSEKAVFRTRAALPSFHFDSNTAHVKLKLSEDKSSVFYGGDDSSNPKSPSKFTFALNVLSNIAFHTGKHYWEVKTNAHGWVVGVAYQGVPRNSWLGSNESSWILHYDPSKFVYKVRHGGESKDVTLELATPKHYLKRVGIYLNVDEGMIQFVDPSVEQVLFTYTEDRFQEPICAAVNPFYHGGSLTLLAGLDVPKFLR